MVSRDRNSHQAASDDEVSARRGRAAASAEGGAPESTSYSIMQNTFRVDPRYSGLKAVGKGSFGIVCSALDSKQVLGSSSQISEIAQHLYVFSQIYPLLSRVSSWVYVYGMAITSRTHASKRT